MRQFAVSQELLLLEVARQAIQSVRTAGASPRLEGSGSPLLVTKGGCGCLVVARLAPSSGTWHRPADVPAAFAAQLLFPILGPCLLPLLIPPAEEYDSQFPAEVMACVSQSVCEVLGNYHASVDDPRVMKVRRACVVRPGGTAFPQCRMLGHVRWLPAPAFTQSRCRCPPLRRCPPCRA